MYVNFVTMKFHYPSGILENTGLLENFLENVNFKFFLRKDCASKNAKLLQSIQEAINYKCHKCSQFLRKWTVQVKQTTSVPRPES